MWKYTSDKVIVMITNDGIDPREKARFMRGFGFFI